MRYFLGFLVAVGLVVLVFVLILHSFSSNGAKTNVPPLSNYANTQTVVKYSAQGPISADQTHQQVDITVGQTQSQLNIIQGYQGNVVSSSTVANNVQSYTAFLNALQLAGFTRGDGSGTTSESGFCPTGARYNYEIISGNNVIQNYWSTSCGNQGTFAGNASLMQTLFQAQIPNYGQLTDGVTL